MNTITIQIPKTIFGLGAIANLGSIAGNFTPSKILIITDPGVVKAGIIDAVKLPLEKAGLKYEVFDGCESDPPISLVEKLGQKIKRGKYDLLVGVGGGSVMDVTKVVARLATNKGMNVFNLIKGEDPVRAMPKILVPTTAGTGSEWSNVAIVSDEKAGMLKKSVSSEKNMPEAVIVDPELMRNLPQEVTADTGMDALVHAIEAYTSYNANLISDMFAETAIKLINDNLRLAYSKGNKNIEARYNLAIAASLAMRAATLAGVGIAHFMSEPLQKRAHISHGKCCSMMLPYVMDFNMMGNLSKFARIAEMMGEDTIGLSLIEAANKSIKAVQRLMGDFGMPMTLAEVKVRKTDIPEMVEEMHTEKERIIKEWSCRNVSREDTARVFLIAIKGLEE